MPIFRYDPHLKDAREGDERLLVEILGVAIGLVSSGGNEIIVSISGDDDRLHLVLSGFGKCPECRQKNWESLRRKAALWAPAIRLQDDSLHLILGIPSSTLHPPVNLEAMAAETGISRDEALMIIGGFVEQGRRHLEHLAGTAGGAERYRAAHSLKGAGKTLRAPELAAAARRVEQALKDHQNERPDISDLETAWRRIESWYREAGRL